MIAMAKMRVQGTIDRDLYERLESYCRERKVSRSSVLGRALEFYLDKIEGGPHAGKPKS